jgi:uncharacterized protein
MRVKCQRIVGGQAVGDAIITRQPINFLTMVNYDTGRINYHNHELFGRSLHGSVLVFPKAVGSSVGAYTIYSMKVANAAPVAMVCTEQADIITSSGCAISNIPLVKIFDEFPQFSTKSELRLSVDATNEVIVIKKNK